MQYPAQLKYKNNQKGVAQVIILLIILLGLGVGLYLVQQKTNLFSRASVGVLPGPETSFSLLGPNDCPAGAFCALPLRPETAGLRIGQQFDVKLYVRADVSAANLFSAQILFPNNLAEVAAIKTDGSFIKNWVENSFDNTAGTISLIGGVPNPGYQTQVGGASGLMATITFQVKAEGSGVVSFADKSAIYSNAANINILTNTQKAFGFSVTSANPFPSFSPISEPYLVKPYLVYPADKPMYPEYQNAVNSYLVELQAWYQQKIGITFKMAPLQVLRAPENYLTIRCGASPTATCLNDPSKLEGNLGYYMNRAIHSGVEQWETKTVALIFAAGGGGYAGSDKYPNDAGWAIVGDWVLEPLSGKASDWGIPCKYSDGWQCSGGVPKGTPAHEIGHAFGLGHPDPVLYPGDNVSIMKWHGGYPTVGFLPYEITALKASPFFRYQFALPSSLPTPTPVASSSPVPSATPIPGSGDGNKDGKVDLIDLSILLTDYNKNSGFRTAIDLNGDGAVNAFDFSLMKNLLIQKGVIKG